MVDGAENFNKLRRKVLTEARATSAMIKKY